MSGFESANFRRSMAQGKQVREFTVSDDADLNSNQTQEEIEAEIKKARQEKIDGPKITSFAKQRIELLTGIGKLTRDVQIDGTTFSLRTLKAKEQRDVTMEVLKGTTQLEALFESRRQQIARALFKIEGIDFSDYINSDDLNDKLNFIDDLEESLVARLFDELTILRNESNNKFGINSEKDVKEVSEDLKK